MKLNSFIKSINITKILAILSFIIVFSLLIIYIGKIYILNNAYSKYEKSAVAEILDAKVNVNIIGRKPYRNITYTNVVYKIYIKQTNEIIKVEDEFTDKIQYKNGEKIILSYYNLYDKNTNIYCGKNYDIKPLSYFNNGSFYRTSDNSYIFCNSDYTDKVINLKIDYPDDRIVDKHLIWFYTDDSRNGVVTLNNINKKLINMIKNKTTFMDITKTSLGKVYNFKDSVYYYSVLNYGENISESIVLTSQSKKNIIDFITNIS